MCAHKKMHIKLYFVCKCCYKKETGETVREREKKRKLITRRVVSFFFVVKKIVNGIYRYICVGWGENAVKIRH